MASSVVKSAAQQLGNLLVEEAKYLYKVRRNIESLQMELEWIECFLEDADTQQHQDKVICKWVAQVRDFAYDSEDIIERFLHQVSHHRQDGIFNTLKWFSCILCTCDAMTLHNLGSDLDFLTSRMSDLTSRLQRYGVQVIRPTGSLEYNAMIREERRTYSYTKEDVIGLDKDIQQVVVQLMNVDVNVVEISGTGGLGKTTLARKVLKHKDIRDYFNNNCVWVYVSKEFDKESIFQEILLGLEMGNAFERKAGHGKGGGQLKGGQSLEQRKDQLKGVQLLEEIQNVLQVRKCLVVLDDIWTIDSWERLKPAFESIRGTSSKILLTTRNRGLLQHVDPNSGYLHILQPLSSENSWKLLQRKAFNRRGSTDGEASTSGQKGIGQNDEPQDDDQVKRELEMEKLGNEMLKHCDGLPIAIIALGGILSTKKTPKEWEDVRKNISSYLISKVQREGSINCRVMEVLELSYNELPFYLKPCFLCLGYFPEDRKISTQKLYHLWEAEGFLVREGEAMNGGTTCYDIGERYLNELVQRSMVEVEECWAVGAIKTCKVHDVMRDMCLRKCKELGFLNHIRCVESGDVLPILSTETKKMRRCALVYDQEGDLVANQFQHAAMGLRSLLLFGPKISLKRWKSFPLLRVLDHEGRRPNSIKCVGHLIHLRYLSLRNAEVGSIPSCVYDLKYLETLDLRLRYRPRLWKMKLPNKFHMMKKLRHLYLPGDYGIKSGVKLRFPVGQMETLKNFDPNRCEMKDLMQMENLRIFSIRKGYVYLFGYTFEDKDVVQGVLEAPVMKNPGQLINSFRLHISAEVINELEPAILSSLVRHPSFNQLRIGIWSTNNITIRSSIFVNSLTRVEMYWCEIGEGGVSALEKLPHLKLLRIHGINNEAIEGNKLSFSAGSFPQLVEFELKLPSQVEECEPGDGALPNLQSLKLHSWGNLEEWKVGDGALPNLQRLDLYGCRKLKNLPNSLTELKLCGCEIWGEAEGGLLLACLEKLHRLQILDISDEHSNKMSFPPGSFPHLTDIHLAWSDMEELEFGDGALPNLQRLKLYKCEKLKEWKAGDGSLPHLQRLKSYGCNKLKKIPNGLPDSIHIECEKHPIWMKILLPDDRIFTAISKYATNS